MTDRIQQLQRLNQEPINKVALALLAKAAPTWVEPERSLGVILLMQWALSEELLEGPELEHLGARVRVLDQGDPEVAFKYLVSPEGDPVISAGELEEQSPEDAARLVLESLSATMVALHP